MKNPLEKSNVTFKLVATNSDNAIKDKNGNFRRFLRSYGVRNTADVLDENGDIRVIRYMPRQSSIFIDEQSIGAGRVNSQTSKPQFLDGNLTVGESQKNLIAFLRAHPDNQDNAHYGFPKQKAVFYEHKAEVIAKQITDDAMEEAKVTSLVFTSDFKSKILPIARYIGGDVNKDSDMIKYDVLQYSKSNPTKFLELLGSATVERYDLLMEAVDAGIIKYDKNSVKWADGRNICGVPQNFEAIKFFSEKSFEHQFSATWNLIDEELTALGGGDNDSEILSETKSSKQVMIEGLSGEELLSMAKEAGVVNWDAPYYTFGSFRAKGKDKFAKLMLENEEARLYIIAQLV